jgi:cytochrome b subunit of formate dehydrogenase
VIRSYKAVLICFVLALFVVAAQAKSAPKAIESSECLACHSDPSLTTEIDGKTVNLSVNEETFKNSIHGAMFGCVDCHTDVKEIPHASGLAKPTCATCHADQQKAYDEGFHAKAIKGGVKAAASCADCHGSPHQIVVSSDPKSPVFHANIPKTCATCHGQKMVMESNGLSAQPVFSYGESVHGQAVKAGKNAAVCTDCHGSHAILQAGDPKSPIFKFNVPQTCAKCHESVQQEFSQSIHGKALTRGNWQSPVCTDCHGIHLIKAHVDPTSSVAAQQLARTTCGRCHEGVRLAQDFGVAGRRATTYLASYHGLANKAGSSVAANCASCHGVHNILPSSDPRAMTSKENLTKTCGQCHPGAKENFVKGKIHIDVPLSADIGSIAVRWVRKTYLWLINLVIGGMLVHNFIIWRRKAVQKRDAHRRLVVRMPKAFRLQHMVLLISFFVLVITGFALKYPDSWFAMVVALPETVRSLVHRIAGAALMAVGVFHLVFSAVNPAGRKFILDMLPTPKDASDAVGTMRYYLGRGGKKPEYPRFNYAEKAEYWALVWGTFVMAATGAGLWFKVGVGNLLPRWSLDVATAIHFYEAILATLAIIVWHFYWIIFDPDVYPMNWAWYDGKMSVEHYQEEHGLDTESVLKAVEDAAAQAEEEVVSSPRH